MKPAATPLSDQAIYERMVSAILDHQLPPGTKLVEDRLAAAFGVSRTRIRPVLVRLANEKVVTLTPNRGAAIAEPSEAEAREVFEVRRMIEPLLVERFIGQATATHLQALKHCIRDEEAARKAGDMRRAIRLSGDFHLQIAEHAGHQTLGGTREGWDEARFRAAGFRAVQLTTDRDDELGELAGRINTMASRVRMRCSCFGSRACNTP